MRTPQEAIDKGVEFLESALDVNGYFVTLSSDNDCFSSVVRQDPSNFSNALIIRNLRQVNSDKAAQLAKRAEETLIEQIIMPGFWRYNPRFKERWFPVDLDDTCFISELLRQRIFELLIKTNVPRILEERNEKGLFRTWISPEYELLPPHIDPIVNINIIGYLGDIPETEAAADWLLRLLIDNEELNTHSYYTTPAAFYYFFALAGETKSDRLRSGFHLISQRTKELLETRVDLNPLDRALLISSLLRTAPGNAEYVQPYIDQLIREQREDGSWQKYAYFGAGFEDNRFVKYTGGEALVTGAAIEAIAHFLAL